MPPTSVPEGKEREQWLLYSPIIVLTGKVQLSPCDVQAPRLVSTVLQTPFLTYTNFF